MHTPNNLDHLVPAAIELPDADTFEALAERRVTGMPHQATPYRMAAARYRNRVLGFITSHEALRQAALLFVRNGEANRILRLEETTTELEAAQAEADRLRTAAKEQAEATNDHAADAGLTLYADEMTQEGIRNAVRRALGGNATRRDEAQGPDAVDRAKARFDGACEAMQEAEQRARKRSDEERDRAHERAGAEEKRLAAEKTTREEAETRRKEALADAENQRLATMNQARKGMPIWLLGILEWAVTLILMIPPAVLLTVGIGSLYFNVKHNVLTKISLLKPETFLQGSVATPLIISFGILLILTILSHVLTLLGYRLRRQVWPAILFGAMIAFLLGVEINMEITAFHQRHLMIAAEANALNPKTMPVQDWWAFAPFGFVAGAPFVLAKVAFALFKEFEKERQAGILDQAKADAKAAADKIVHDADEAINKARQEHEEEAKAEAARREREIGEEAEAARRYADALTAAETQLQEAEAADRKRREDFERQVTDFMRTDPNVKLAVRCVGALNQTLVDLEKAVAAVAVATEAQASFLHPLQALPDEMASQLAETRQHVLDEYRAVNVMLGLAEEDSPSSTPPMLARQPAPDLGENIAEVQEAAEEEASADQTVDPEESSEEEIIEAEYRQPDQEVTSDQETAIPASSNGHGSSDPDAVVGEASPSRSEMV